MIWCEWISWIFLQGLEHQFLDPLSCTVHLVVHFHLHTSSNYQQLSTGVAIPLLHDNIHPAFKVSTDTSCWLSRQRGQIQIDNLWGYHPHEKNTGLHGVFDIENNITVILDPRLTYWYFFVSGNWSDSKYFIFLHRNYGNFLLHKQEILCSLS
jgi:hypothetical protein